MIYSGCTITAANTDGLFQVFFEGNVPDFIWAYFAPDKLENLNETNYNCLMVQAYDDSELQTKLNIAPSTKSLLSRLPRDETLEKKSYRV
jgi:hypothetical protein